MQVSQGVKHGVDAGAVAVAGGTVLGYLPSIAAAFSIVWLTMQMIIHWPQFKERIKKIFK